MKKLIAGILFTLLCSNIYAQNFEGTYEASGYSITLIKYTSNNMIKYDGELNYNNKKIAFKGGVAVGVGGSDYRLLYISTDKGGGVFGDKRQSATLKLYSNGSILWSSSTFSGMPTSLLLKPKGNSIATQPSARPSNSQTQSQSNSINVNGNNNTVIIQNQQ